MNQLRRRASLSSLTLLLALLLPQVAHAQGTKYIGLVGGATLSDMSDYYGGISTDSKWGGNAGLILGMRTYNGIVVSLEPAWTQLGGRVSGTNATMDYIEVPLTVGGVTSGGGNMRYGGYAGIAPTFNLTCTIEEPAGACNNLNSTAWFLPIGFRLMSNSGKGTVIGLDIRYSIPLGSSFDNLTVHQRSWAFRIILAKESR